MNDKTQMTKKEYDIRKRSLYFAVNVAMFIRKIQRNILSVEYIKQLVRSSASVGANMEEADGSNSKRDFINKVGIAKKEAKESLYWLKLIRETKLVNNPENVVNLEELIKENSEITLILSSIVNKARKKD